MKTNNKIKFLLIAALFIISANLSSQTYYFPISHRLVSNTAGNAPMQDASLIPIIMDELNKAFANADIQFFVNFEEIIRSSYWFDF